MDKNEKDIYDSHPDMTTNLPALKKYAQIALDVQTAVNLSGIVFSWDEAMKFICEESHYMQMGTHWKNRHPINVLFANQVTHLTGGFYDTSPDMLHFAYAYDWCEKVLKK